MGRLTTRLSEGLLRKDSATCLSEGSLRDYSVLTPCLFEGSLKDRQLTTVWSLAEWWPHIFVKARLGTTQCPSVWRLVEGQLPSCLSESSLRVSPPVCLKAPWGTTHHLSVWRLVEGWLTTCLSEGLLRDNSPLVCLKVWCGMIHHLSAWRLIEYDSYTIQ